MLSILPRHARYYFCQVDMPRALPATELQQSARKMGLQGEAYTNVSEALQAAKHNAHTDDLIVVGGSTFVVAALLEVEDYGTDNRLGA